MAVPTAQKKKSSTPSRAAACCKPRYYGLMPSRRPDRIDIGDKVLTPSGRTAVVMAFESDGRADCEYVDRPGALDGQATVVLALLLLRRWRKGTDRPQPVRFGKAA